MTHTRQLADLTTAQRQAVEHIDGPLLILAGPGSGKTRVVTHRIAYLLEQGIAAEQIVALTFTNKAADEMRRRLEQLGSRRGVWLSTFHRFCVRLLRQYAAQLGLAEHFTIYDTEDSLRALRHVLKTMGHSTSTYSPRQLAVEISRAKNDLVEADRYERRSGYGLSTVVADVYPAYQQLLLTSSAVDFDDLLLHVAVLLRDHPEIRRSLDERFKYVLIDEYQDTNFAQYAILRALCSDYPNLAATGDPDQSIFGWRGANLNNILQFEQDFPEVRVVRLEQNYRSTKCILRVADTLISNNVNRMEKRLYTDNAEGEAVRLASYATQKEEADTIAATIAFEIGSGKRRALDYAIFYRINALSRSLELALSEHGIPYQLVKGVEFFQRQEIKNVLAYIHLVSNPRDDMALLRIINTPPRGIGKKTIERLVDHAARRSLTLFEAARQSGLVESLTKAAATRVARFVTMVDQLCEHAGGSLEPLLGQAITESGYQDHLADSGLEEDQDRLANIEELLTVAREFDERHPEQGGLEQFLEETALVGDTDDWESQV
ncbi:MAG: UvrD-helicase domain-containing protein, partial [Planctomycetales bacterium]